MTTTINWPCAFSKFGFGDGDIDPRTDDVAEFLDELGYDVQLTEYPMHNTVISQLTLQVSGQPMIGDDIDTGYADPRTYLVPLVVRQLDKRFGPGEWYG